MSKSNSKNSSSRSWCFTLNNYTPEEVETVKTFPCQYIVFGYEVGENNTPHLQGYFHCESKRSLATLKKKLSSRAHYEVTQDNAAAIAYCKKDGNIFESGTPPQQGQRTDVEGVRALLDKRTSMLEVAQANFALFTRSYRALERYQQLTLQPRDPADDPPQVVWIYGPPGSGKTKFPFSKHKLADIYMKPPGPWFDGYHQQPAVVLDDFDANWMNFRSLLHLLDRYPLQVPIKGGFVQFNSKFIYITSDRHPSKIYTNSLEYKQVHRRCMDILSSSEIEEHFLCVDDRAQTNAL